MVGNMWEKATMHTEVLNQNLLNSYQSTIHFKISNHFKTNHYFQDWSKCRRGYTAQLSLLCQRVVKFESPSETCESSHRGETI